MYNVFISYRRDGGYEMARLLYEHLKSVGLNPFFDLEELRSGPFNVRLYKTIDECPNFLLVLPKGALKRCTDNQDWLRLEIEHALKNSKNIIPVMMNGFTWEDLPESIAPLSNYNGVEVSREYFDATISKIISMLKGIIPQQKKAGDAERTQNTYFSFEDKKEIERLKKQQQLLKEIDKDTYERIKAQYPALRILDIGSNNGNFIMDRLGKSASVEKLIGFEYDEKTVNAANEKYGVAGKIAFVQANVEDESFLETIKQTMDQFDIESFNVVNISMVLLHLKNPYRLLKLLRQVMEKGATLIIKDIDDGFNIAYPDEHGYFERVMSICAKSEFSGYRYSGRQIYTFLKRTGYVDCKLEKLGLTTVGMDFDEKSTFFDIYFSFIPDDLRIMVEKYPENIALQEDLNWLNSVYEKLEEEFQNDAFFFSLGFILFTAKK